LESLTQDDPDEYSQKRKLVCGYHTSSRTRFGIPNSIRLSKNCTAFFCGDEHTTLLFAVCQAPPLFREVRLAAEDRCRPCCPRSYSWRDNHDSTSSPVCQAPLKSAAVTPAKDPPTPQAIR
jgi:hypothetical protein